MAIQYLKKSPKTSSTDDTKTTGIVQDLLKDIETTKEQGCIDLTKKFDKYDGDIIVSKERIEEIKKTLDQKTKDDVQFSYDRVRKFAEAQLKNYGQDFEVELIRRFICRSKARSCKHCWMLCTWWKICSYSISSNECNNCKSSWC